MDENLNRAIAQLEQASTGSLAPYRGALGLVLAAARQQAAAPSGAKEVGDTVLVPRELANAERLAMSCDEINRYELENLTNARLKELEDRGRQQLRPHRRSPETWIMAQELIDVCKLARRLRAALPAAPSLETEVPRG